MLIDLLWQSKVGDKNKIYFIIFGTLIIFCMISMFGGKRRDTIGSNASDDKDAYKNGSPVMFGTFVMLLFLYYRYS